MALRPRPCWGAYSTPPEPELDLRRPTSKGRDKEGWEREGKEERKGGKSKEERDIGKGGEGSTGTSFFTL